MSLASSNDPSYKVYALDSFPSRVTVTMWSETDTVCPSLGIRSSPLRTSFCNLEFWNLSSRDARDSARSSSISDSLASSALVITPRATPRRAMPQTHITALERVNSIMSRPSPRRPLR